MPRFSVVIVNYNGGAYLQGAVASLEHQTFTDFETLIVDNASQDRSFLDLDTSGLNAVECLSMTENLGFASANNRAAGKASGEWLVLLNPDAAAAPDWLEKIDAAIRRHPEVAMFASAQLDMADASRLDGAGDCYLGFGIPWRGGFGRQASELPGEGECFGPCGAGAAYRRSTFLEAGGFDDDFFCFCEDIDLAFRLRLRGERCIFLPDAVIHHAGGGVAGRTSAFSICHGTRNRLWTYARNMPGPLLWLTLPGHVGLTAMILARGLMTGRFAPTWKGLVAGVSGLGAVLRQRRDIQATRTASLGQLLAAMSWNPLRMLARRPDVRALKKQG